MRSLPVLGRRRASGPLPRWIPSIALVALVAGGSAFAPTAPPAGADSVLRCDQSWPNSDIPPVTNTFPARQVGTYASAQVGVTNQFGGIGVTFDLNNNASAAPPVNILSGHQAAGAGWQTSYWYQLWGQDDIQVFNQAAGNNMRSQWGYGAAMSASANALTQTDTSPIWSDHITPVDESAVPKRVLPNIPLSPCSPATSGNAMVENGRVNITSAIVPTPTLGSVVKFTNQYTLTSTTQQSWPSWIAEQAFYLDRDAAGPRNLRVFFHGKDGGWIDGPIRPQDNGLPSYAHVSCGLEVQGHPEYICSAHDDLAYTEFVWDINGREIAIAVMAQHRGAQLKGGGTNALEYHTYVENLAYPTIAAGASRTYGTDYYVGTRAQLADMGRLEHVDEASTVLARAKDGRFVQFAIKPDGVLHQRIQLATGWGSWTTTGASVRGLPSIGTASDGRLEVFAVDSTGGLIHKWQITPTSTSGWSAWQWEGVKTIGMPAVGRSADGRLEVFAVDGNNGLIHRWQQTDANNTWSAWQWTGRFVMAGTSPAVASLGDGRLELFEVAPSNGELTSSRQTTPNGGWGPTQSLGKRLRDVPTVATNLDKRLELFGTGMDGTLFHWWQSASPGFAWNGPASMNMKLDGQPAVARLADGRLMVFVREPYPQRGLISTVQDARNAGWNQGWTWTGQFTDGSPTVTNAKDASGNVELFYRENEPGTRLMHAWQITPSSPNFTGFGSHPNLNVR